MGSEWNKVFLDDIAEVIDSRHKTPQYSDEGYPMVRVVDIKNGPLELSHTKKVALDVYKDFSKGRDPQIGDLVFSRVGSYGNVAYVSSNDRFCLGQNTALISPKNKDRFLYYSLISPSVRKQIENMVVGAVQKTISLKSIKNLEIPSPPESEREKIARFLSDLDNKITLNRQINQTLEQMAQALFKSWFVDFDPVIDNALAAGNPIPDELQPRAEQRKALRLNANGEDGYKPLPESVRALFPDAFEESELGWVPKGWAFKPAVNVAKVSIGKTPPRKQSEWFSDNHKENLTWISIRDMGRFGAFTQESSEYLTSDAVQKFNVKVVPKGSVLLSFKLTLGRVSIASEELTTNEAIAHFAEPKFGINREYLYCYLVCFNFQSLGSTSSIATAVNSKIIKQMPILCPSESVLAEFERSVKPYFDRMGLLDQETKTLTTLRDTLLPKLISGELQLDQLPDGVASVA